MINEIKLRGYLAGLTREVFLKSPDLAKIIIRDLDECFIKEVNKEKPKVIILDDNPISIMGYAEEYPENWKKICEALEKDTCSNLKLNSQDEKPEKDLKNNRDLGRQFNASHPDTIQDKDKTKCVMSTEGICRSDYYYGKKCDGIKIPEHCPYKYISLKKKKGCGKEYYDKELQSQKWMN